MNINSISDFRQAVRMGSYTSIGCYPLFFLMADGETVSPKAAKAERRQILEALRDKSKGERADESWLPMDIDVNYEDEDMSCAHTNEPIECAYPSE